MIVHILYKIIIDLSTFKPYKKSNLTKEEFIM